MDGADTLGIQDHGYGIQEQADWHMEILDHCLVPSNCTSSCCPAKRYAAASGPLDPAAEQHQIRHSNRTLFLGCHLQLAKHQRHSTSLQLHPGSVDQMLSRSLGY